MASGTRLLRFRCTGCGNCCREVRVPVTGADLARLVESTAREPYALVDWLPADRVDIQGEPETLVLVDAGFRLMVLRHELGQCLLLGTRGECTAYASRPAPCRVYPLDASFGRRGGVRRLRLLDRVTCDYARDGRVEVDALRSDTLRQKHELGAYALAVSEWNRLQRHRLRLKQRLGRSEDFLTWLLSPPKHVKSPELMSQGRGCYDRGGGVLVHTQRPQSRGRNDPRRSLSD